MLHITPCAAVDEIYHNSYLRFGMTLVETTAKRGCSGFHRLFLYLRTCHYGAQWLGVIHSCDKCAKKCEKYL